MYTIVRVSQILQTHNYEILITNQHQLIYSNLKMCNLILRMHNGQYNISLTNFIM